MPTVVEGDFEWDSEKAASNLVKHGVSFPEAATVFADPLAVYLDDGSGLGNMVVIGTSLQERVLWRCARGTRPARSDHQRVTGHGRRTRGL